MQMTQRRMTQVDNQQYIAGQQHHLPQGNNPELDNLLYTPRVNEGIAGETPVTEGVVGVVDK